MSPHRVSTPSGSAMCATSCSNCERSGTTILLSSHQLSEVEAVCDEVTILNRGRVAARGHIDDLLNVSGQVSVRIRGVGELPPTLAALSSESIRSGRRLDDVDTGE